MRFAARSSISASVIVSVVVFRIENGGRSKEEASRFCDIIEVMCGRKKLSDNDRKGIRHSYVIFR